MINFRHKYIILLLNIFFFVNLSFSQQDDLNNLLQDKKNLVEISGIVNNYLKTMPDGAEKQQLEKHFARWSYYQSIHLGDEGELVNISEKTINAIKNKEVANTSKSSSGDWYFEGPHYSPDGIGRVDRITFHPTNPNIIYIGTPAGGLWRTTNGGSDWTPISSFIPSLGISGIVVDYSNTNRIYVLTGSGDAGGLVTAAGYLQKSVGVLVSDDYGSTWRQTGTLDSNSFNGYRLIQHPTNPQILFAATTDGIYKTINGGEVWLQVQPGKYYDLAFKPGTPSTVYASGVSSMYYSNSDGDLNTWHSSALNPALAPNGRVEIAVTPDSPNSVYLIAGPDIDSVTFNGLYRSFNSGQSFTQLLNSPNLIFQSNGGGSDQSNYDLGITVSPTNDQVIVTCALIAWKSDDGGSTITNISRYWNSSNGIDYIHPDIHDIQFNPLNGYLYAANDGGLYVSENEGGSWINLSSGISTTQFYHIDDYDNNEYAFLGGAQDNGSLYRVTNTGSFTRVGGGDGFEAVIDYSNQNKGLTVANISVYKFTDFANKTKSQIAEDSFFPQVELNTANPDRVYYSYDSLYTYQNGGQLLLGNGKINGYNALKTCPSNSSRIYAAGGYSFANPTGKLYETSDAGTTWDTVSDNSGFPLTNQRITDIGVNPTNSAKVFICYGGYTADTKVFYSTNAGDSWNNYTFNMPNVPIWSIEVDASNNLYVGTDIGVFYKPHTSNNWEAYYNNLPNVPISDLAINEPENQLLAATFGRGVWKSTLKTSCSDYLSTSADFEGKYFVSVTTDISTTSTIVGGVGTDVVFRAGHNVVLSPGFQADGEPGNKFAAYIGDCESGLPTSMSANQPVFPNELYKYDISLSRSKGTVEITKVGGGEVEILIRLFGKIINNVEVFIAPINMINLDKVASIKNLKKENTIRINTKNLDKGNYMLYLIVDNEVTHLQELYLK